MALRVGEFYSYRAITAAGTYESELVSNAGI